MIYRMDKIPNAEYPDTETLFQRVESKIQNILTIARSLLIRDEVRSSMLDILAISHIMLDIQPETLEFICWWRTIKKPEQIIRILFDVGEILNIQRFILYRIVNVTEAEILLLYSSDREEKERAGEFVLILENPNLEQAVRTRALSQIPVPGIGIDAAFPILEDDPRTGKNIFEKQDDLIIGIDNTGGARTFSKKDMVTLTSVALLLGTAYDRGYEQNKKWLDGLTGLSNRSALNYAIDYGVNIFNKPMLPIRTVAFFDIDFFKKFNTEHGHHTGDAVIRHVADIIGEESIRLGGRAFRYGGEELVITFDRTVLHEEVDSIRRRISDASCRFEGKEYRVNVSVWFCTVNRQEDEDYLRIHKQLIRTANAAMNHAKEAGRNQTMEYPLANE